MHQLVASGTRLIVRPPTDALIARGRAIALAVALVAAVVAFAPVPAHAATGLQFTAKADYETGEAPEAVATGDLNGDGKPDIVVANKAKNTVSVLINNGDGTFKPQAEYKTGVGPVAVALADVDGDGKLDIVTANATGGSVSVLLGNGDGTFKAQAEYAPVGATPSAVAVGDLTGNGKPDIVLADKGGNTVAVLLNEGGGTFKTPATQYLTGVVTEEAPLGKEGEGPVGVALADLTGKGKLDVVTANSTSNTVSVLLGNGSGAFGAAHVYPTGEAPSGVALADLNNDGKPDIVAANSKSNTVSVLLGNGDGTFAEKKDFATGKGPRAVAVADMSDASPDNKLDIVTANEKAKNVATEAPSGSASVLLGNGDGTFAKKQDFETGVAPKGVALADFNGDGKTDIVTANSVSNTASVLLNSSVGVIGLSPSSLTFPAQLFGTKSAPQSVTVTNTGEAPVKITSIAPDITGNFATSGCVGASLAVGASCAVSVTFTPKGYAKLKAESGSPPTEGLTIETSVGEKKTLKLKGEGLPPPPVVQTTEVTEIVGSYVSLTGTVISQGPKAGFHFEYGATSAYGSATPDLPLSSSFTKQVISATLSLEPGATYHYRLVAHNLAGTVYGADQAFTIPPEEPTLVVLKHGRLASVLKHGLRLRVGDTSAAIINVKLLIDAHTARAAHLAARKGKQKGPLVVGTARVTLTAAGAKTITITFGHNAKRKLGALAGLKLTIVATPSTSRGVAGNPTEITAKIRR
jgi:hypothetical protein